MSEPPALRSLCIVSSDPVRSGELLAALRTMVDSHEGLEIVVDRRRGESGCAPGSPSDDRRRQPLVDVKVKTDGFAILPSPSASRADGPLSEADPDRPELLLLEVDPVQLECARVLDFVRRRRAVRRQRLVLASWVGAALVLLALVPAMTTFTNRTYSAAAPPAESPAAIATAPPPRPRPPATSSGGSPQSSESMRLESTRPEPTPQVVERTDRPRVQARPPAAERAAQPRARVASAPMVVQGPNPTAPQPVAPHPVSPQPVAPPAAAQPPVAPSPSEVTSRPEPPTQAAKAPEAPAPRPQPGASTQPNGAVQTNGPVQSPEPARVREAAPTNQTPARSPEAAPARQAPVRPHEAAPARQTPVRLPDAAPPRQALGRPSDAPPARQAPTAVIPDAPPASGGGSPSDHRGGFGDQFKNLGTVIERDLIDATADAKRQGDDFKALQNRFLRAWDGLKQSFGGSAEK